VDVAVLYRETPRTLGDLPLDIEDDLRGELGRPVQVVVLNAAPPDLVHRVLRDGRLLLEHDRGARIRFEVKARNAYWDVQPYLDRYRRSVAR
jgi:hypothetical protein